MEPLPLIKCPSCSVFNDPSAKQCQKCQRPFFAEDRAGTSSAPTAPAPPLTPMRVSVMDVDMPFQSMVTLMVKWALASVPALIVLVAVVSAIGIAIGTLFGGLALVSRMF